MRNIFRDPIVQKEYERTGYAVVPLLSPEEVSSLQRLYDDLQVELQSAFYTSLWSQNLAYRQRVHEAITRVMEARLEPVLCDYRICLGNFAVKGSGGIEESRVPMHQDWTVVDETRFTGLTVWCPLIDVNPVNGCLGIVAGSYRFVENIRPNAVLDTYFSPYIDVDKLLWEKYLSLIPVHAGTAIIYNSRTVHASHPNRGDKIRVAAVGVAVPREAQLLHYFRHGPNRVEAFLVNDDFYWKDVELGKPPTAARSIGEFTIPYEQVTPEQVATMIVPPGPHALSPGAR